MKWSRPWNDRKLGVYIRTYSCKDRSGNTGKTTRKFTIIDKTKPILTRVGRGHENYEASRDIEYVDKGATCHDYVDGVLSHSVQVSGNVVNMRIPGKYVIRYDCQDLSGNAAVPVNRTVTVKDTTCPKIKLKGMGLVFVEAGFPYTDAGATATDTLDGDITKKIWTDGDTVDTSNAFYSFRSCSDIKTHYKGAKTGEYYITSYIAAKRQYTRLLVWCDMQNSAQTYYAVVCGKRVVPYGKAQGDCPKYGLKMAIFTSSAQKKSAVAKFHDPRLPAHSRYFPHKGATTDYYLCSTNAKGRNTGLNHNQIGANRITRAEAGKYVIMYHVSDKAGNKECKTPKRTVVVKDTLPPVISLHLKNRVIHVSGSRSKANPASTAKGNPFIKSFRPTDGRVANKFMAETSTTKVNAWIVAAVASAITGVALLSIRQ